MYDETNVPLPDYRVRPVVRYIVTRYCHPFQARDGSHGSTGQSEVIAEFDKEDHAEAVRASLEASESVTQEAMVEGDPEDMAEALAQISQLLKCHNNLEDILHSIDSYVKYHDKQAAEF